MITRPAVLVTGGAKRIGAAIVEAFAGRDWHVIIHHGRSQDEAAALAGRLPSAETYACDLADPGACEAMINSLAERLSDWRVLVNSAGVFALDTSSAMDDAIFTEAMAVNAAAPTRLAQRYLAAARSPHGRRVIQITDQKISNPNPDFFSYTMSKHALAGTVPMLAASAPRAEDRVYALAPGAILASHDQSEAETERSHRMNLLQRKTGADEIARATQFLAEGWLASGETLYVDSGQHLLRQPRDVLFLARQ